MGILSSLYCLDCMILIGLITVSERAECAATSEHQQIKKPFINLTAGAANAHNTARELYLQRVSLFGCVVSICSTFVVKLMFVFLIFRCFLFAER